MVKKFLFSIIFIGAFISVAHAGPRGIVNVDSYIGPATSASNVTISTGGPSTLNCLTSFSAISNSTYTFRLLDGGTTVYSLLMPASSGIVQDYDPSEPICASINSTIQLKVDNGTFSINYFGFVKRLN